MSQDAPPPPTPPTPPVNPVNYASAGGQRPNSKANGLGIASLVLGILGLLLSWVPCVGFFGAALAGVGLVLGIVGLILAKNDAAMGKGSAIAGTILSAVALLLWVLVTLVLGGLLAAGGAAAGGAVERGQVIVSMQADAALVVNEARQAGVSGADIRVSQARFDDEMERIATTMTMDREEAEAAAATALQTLEDELAAATPSTEASE